MKLITFAWGKLYRIYAERLKLSCERFGLELEIVSRDGEAPSREAAWAARPKMLLEALEDGEPVLYLDADCQIRRLPEFEQMVPRDVDFAAVWSGRAWRLGVLLVMPTLRARLVLQELHDAQALELKNDEDYFPGIVKDVGAKVYELPRTYAWVEKWGDRQAVGNCSPVIEANA